MVRSVMEVALQIPMVYAAARAQGWNGYSGFISKQGPQQ